MVKLTEPSYTTKFPLYLLGVEKPRDYTETPYPLDEEVNGSPLFNVANIKASPADREDITNALDDPRPLVLTRILKAAVEDPFQGANVNASCFVYNVYKTKTSEKWCQSRNIINMNLDNPNWGREGWAGLDRLGDDLKAAVRRENATHSTGKLNT